MVDEGVGEAEFFAEDYYAFGLGDSEVVDCEGHFEVLFCFLFVFLVLRWYFSEENLNVWK